MGYFSFENLMNGKTFLLDRDFQLMGVKLIFYYWIWGIKSLKWEICYIPQNNSTYQNEIFRSLLTRSIVALDFSVYYYSYLFAIVCILFRNGDSLCVG